MKLLSKLRDYKNQVLGGAIVLATAVPALADSNADVDYSTLTTAVNFSQIIVVLMGVAALIVGFVLVKNNIGNIISFLKRRF